MLLRRTTLPVPGVAAFYQFASKGEHGFALTLVCACFGVRHIYIQVHVIDVI